MGLLAALTAVSAATSTTFVDRSSTRRFFATRQRPHQAPAAPWGALPLSGIEQLEPRGDSGEAWALEAATGRVHLLGPDGRQRPVAVAGSGGLVAPPGSRLVGVGATALVVAEPARVRWLGCAARGAACHETASAATSTGRVHAATTSGEQLWLGTVRGLARSAAVGTVPVLLNVSGGEPVLAVATAGSDSVAAATAQTLWRLRAGTWSHLGVGGVIDSNITSLAFFAGSSGSSNLAIGTRHALHVLDSDGIVARFSGLQGLPVAGITHLHSSGAPNASLWIGTTQGLVELSSPAAAATAIGTNPEWRYYNGDRWLVSSPEMVSVVTALAEVRTNLSSATVAVATPQGLAQIHLQETTLEAKAAHYQALISPQHDRYGWVAQVPLARHGDRESYVLTDGDNDGSSTGYYMASQVFRWLVTKSPEALANSWRAFRAVEFLHNVTRPLSKEPGFVARTAVRCGEPHQGPSGGVCQREKGHCAQPLNASCSGCSPPAGSCTGFSCQGW